MPPCPKPPPCAGGDGGGGLCCPLAACAAPHPLFPPLFWVLTFVFSTADLHPRNAVEMTGAHRTGRGWPQPCPRRAIAQSRGVVPLRGVVSPHPGDQVAPPSPAAAEIAESGLVSLFFRESKGKCHGPPPTPQDVTRDCACPLPCAEGSEPPPGKRRDPHPQLQKCPWVSPGQDILLACLLPGWPRGRWLLLPAGKQSPRLFPTEAAGLVAPSDGGNVPSSGASLAPGEGSSVHGRTHRSPAHEEMGSTSECKPASRMTCAPAQSPRTDGQTDSSSPGLVQSPKQGTAARHIPALAPAAKGTESPASPTRPSPQHSSHRTRIWVSTACSNLLLYQQSPFGSSYGSRVWKITVEVPAPPATAVPRGRTLALPQRTGAQYQGSARCCWL